MMKRLKRLFPRLTLWRSNLNRYNKFIPPTPVSVMNLLSVSHCFSVICPHHSLVLYIPVSFILFPKKKTREQKEAELIPKMQEAVNYGLRVLESAFEHLDIKAGNSDSEDEEVVDRVDAILEPKV